MYYMFLRFYTKFVKNMILKTCKQRLNKHDISKKSQNSRDLSNQSMQITGLPLYN